MRLTFKSKGSFKNTERYLKHQQTTNHFEQILHKYGQLGVAALMEATPRDTGEAANSWYYAVEKTARGQTLSWNNSKMAGSTPLVVLLQYGHGTTGGTFVQGRDFINPALRTIIENISQDIWKEVLHG